MLTSLHIRNFKAWKDSGPIRLAPLTVILGANGSGKSSLAHLLLALKQTALSTDDKAPLYLGDENALIELGTFAECLHNHDLNESLQFELGWQLDAQLELQDPLNKTGYTGDELKLDVSIKADPQHPPYVQKLSYTLYQQHQTSLAVTYICDQQHQRAISSEPYQLTPDSGQAWPIADPDKFYRISAHSRACFQNAEFLSDFADSAEAALSRIHYLGPLRVAPKRIYSWSGQTPDSAGQQDECAIAAILAACAHQRQIQCGPAQPSRPFDQCIGNALKDLGLADSFTVKAVGENRRDYEALVRTQPGARTIKLGDAGFGVSQVLPILVQAFYCPPHSTLWIEQPEIHLHAQVQAELADVLISAIKAEENGNARQVQLIVASHSEPLFNRLLRRVAEGVLTTDQIALYFCRKHQGASELEALKLNALGEIENWPEDLFGDEMADISGRAVAALQQKIRGCPNHADTSDDQSDR